MLDIDISKFENSVIKNLDKKNITKIVGFLVQHHCDYIEELFEDYLDIFTFDYNDFVNRFNVLNKKYNNNLIEEIREDMNILEEFYY